MTATIYLDVTTATSLMCDGLFEGSLLIIHVLKQCLHTALTFDVVAMSMCSFSTWDPQDPIRNKDRMHVRLATSG